MVDSILRIMFVAIYIPERMYNTAPWICIVLATLAVASFDCPFVPLLIGILYSYAIIILMCRALSGHRLND